MSIIFYISITPILLLVAIPLSIFAAFTTTLAFSTLFFRALVVYAELAAALIQDHLAVLDSPKEKPPSSKTITEATQSRRKSRRSSAASGSSNGGSSTPKAPDTSGFGMYSGGAARDFEGVGGWRIPGSDDEDASWTSMNSRLELPSVADDRRRNHHRSRTSGSLSSHHLPLRSPGFAPARTPPGAGAEAYSTSPEEYFPNRAASKSTTALDSANIGRTLLRHKSSSSSSSTRTSHLMLSNT